MCPGTRCTCAPSRGFFDPHHAAVRAGRLGHAVHPGLEKVGHPRPGAGRQPGCHLAAQVRARAHLHFIWGVVMKRASVFAWSPYPDIALAGQQHGAAHSRRLPPMAPSRSLRARADVALVAQLTPADGAELDRFGASLSVSGTTVLVGAPGTKVGNNPSQGAAYVFDRNRGKAPRMGSGGQAHCVRRRRGQPVGRVCRARRRTRPL